MMDLFKYYWTIKRGFRYNDVYDSFTYFLDSPYTNLEDSTTTLPHYLLLSCPGRLSKKGFNYQGAGDQSFDNLSNKKKKEKETEKIIKTLVYSSPSKSHHTDIWKKS